MRYNLPTPTTPCEHCLAMVQKLEGGQTNVYDWKSGSKEQTFSADPMLKAEWVSGGTTGGSCWDDGDARHYGREADPPEELTSLDGILEAVCPMITFLEYRALTRELVKYDSRNSSGYYGNSTDYQMKIVHLRELYDYLVEKGWMPEEYR